MFRRASSGLWRYMRGHRLVAAAICYVAVLVALIPLSPLVVPFDPQTADPTVVLQAPSWTHWLGTDNSGMDIFSRLLSATRVDLTIAVVASTISLIIGSLLGVMSGYFRGVFSELIARGADSAQSFPLFVLAMVLVATRGPGVLNIIVVLGVLNIPMYIRLVRARTFALRDSLFVEAARSIGARDRRIVVRHLLPNALAPALIQFSVNIGWAILFTAGLSFVGAGVRTPTPEWGLMIADGAPNIVTGEWWPALFPGIVIGMTVFSFAVLGDALEHVLDPRRRH